MNQDKSQSSKIKKIVPKISEHKFQELEQGLEKIADENNVIIEKIDLGTDVVSITIDNPEHVPGTPSIDFLAEISPDFTQFIEDMDIYSNAYNIQLSSPGATRMLTEDRHWAKAVGHLMSMIVKDNEGNKQKLIGRLQEFDPNERIIVFAEQKLGQKGRKVSYYEAKYYSLDFLVKAKVEIEF